MMAECRGGGEGDCLIKLFGKTIPVPEAKDLHPSGGGGSGSSSSSIESDVPENSSDPEVVDAEDPNKSSPATTQQPGDAASLREKLKKPDKVLPCPRCNSMDTKFCYFNNYNVNQPRHFCKNCQRYWTAGGAMRNVPVGAGRRKNKHAVAASHFFQRVRAVLPDAADPIKTNGTVLSFGHDPFVDLKGEKLLAAPGPPCSEGSSNSRNDEMSRGHGGGIKEKSTVVEKPAANGGGVQRPATASVMNWATVWPYSCAPSPAAAPYFSSGIAIPVYPAAPAGYWGCMVPGPWSLPWPMPQPPPPGVSLSPTSAPSVSSSGPDSLAQLGKRPSRESDDGRPSDHGSGKVWTPKTIRIDDADEVARSSIWSLIGVNEHKKQDADHAGAHRLATVFEPKKMAMQSMIASAPPLHANPVALTRSVTFQEGS